MSVDSLALANDSYPMDKLLAKLTEQQSKFVPGELKAEDDDDSYGRLHDNGSSSNSLPITPATDGFPTTAPTTRPASATLDGSRQDPDEVLRLKLQLAQAQNHISKLDHELAQSRNGGSDCGGAETTQSRFSGGQFGRENPWASGEDAQSDTSDPLSAKAFAQSRGIWANPKGSFTTTSLPASAVEPSPGNWLGGRGFSPAYLDSTSALNPSEAYRGDRLEPDNDLLSRQGANRRPNRFDARLSAPQGYNVSYGTVDSQFDAGGSSMPVGNTGMAPSHNHVGVNLYPQYQPQPIGTPLSPHASEFTSKAGWKSEVAINSL